jgi:hypothetical protein
MGATLTSTASEVLVTLEVRGGVPGQSVRVVESGQPGPSYALEASEFRQEHRLRLPPAGGFVRFELHDASGAIALSNPIHYLRP